MYTVFWKLSREHGILEHLIGCPELLTTQRRVPGNLPPLQSLCSNFRLPQGWPFRPGWAPQVEVLEIPSESTLSCSTQGARFERGKKKAKQEELLKSRKAWLKPMHVIKNNKEEKSVCVLIN